MEQRTPSELKMQKILQTCLTSGAAQNPAWKGSWVEPRIKLEHFLLPERATPEVTPYEMEELEPGY